MSIENDLSKPVKELDKEKKPRMSFSKKVIIAVTFMGFIMFFYTLVYSAMTRDSMPLSYLIPSVFGAFAVAIGFFLKKAEKENQIKLQKCEWKDKEEV